MPSPDVSVVILTMGDRPVELRTAIESTLAQVDVALEVVVVANGVRGATLDGVPDDRRVRVVERAENLGIPGGRNAGAAAARAPLLVFLDDDARFVASDVVARGARLMTSDERLAVVALRIVDPDGLTARRHVPRLGARHPERSGPVTAFLGGACVVRARAFDEAGGFAGEFFYAMEETDLAWRLVDRRWSLRYDGMPAVEHPATVPARHAGAIGRTMRNRVWLVHRSLPAPLAVAYVATWLVIGVVRQPGAVRTVVAVVVSAWRERPGPRRPVAWRTVWRLTRLGRPPIV